LCATQAKLAFPDTYQAFAVVQRAGCAQSGGHVANTILVVTGSYQFGNNPGLFQDALYVGRSLDFPITISYLDESGPTVSFFFETHDIETWGAWKGHQVLLNGAEIGRLKDPNNTSGRLEQFEIQMQMSTFIQLVKYSAGKPAKADLEIVLDMQSPAPGLADDFVLTRIETSENVVVELGW
jgi:hypothetical protein